MLLEVSTALLCVVRRDTPVATSDEVYDTVVVVMGVVGGASVVVMFASISFSQKYSH